MKTAIMQPYFFPYIGYWQLLNAVDKFVICDKMQFTKKGWMRHNYILHNGQPTMFTVPVQHGSRDLNICDRYITDQYFDKEATKIVRKIESAYSKAPYFKDVMPVLEQCFLFEEKNLFLFILNSVKAVSDYLGIPTDIVVLSEVERENCLKKQDRVIEICRQMGTNYYINTMGGLEIYDRAAFESKGLELKFIKPKIIEYKQFENEFVPNLSIIDIMMFNSKPEINEMLNMYDLVEGRWLSSDLTA